MLLIGCRIIEPTSEEEEQNGNGQDEQYDAKEGDDYDNSKESKKDETTDVAETSSEPPRGLGMFYHFIFQTLYAILHNFVCFLQVCWVIEEDSKCEGLEH